MLLNNNAFRIFTILLNKAFDIFTNKILRYYFRLYIYIFFDFIYLIFFFFDHLQCRFLFVIYSLAIAVYTPLYVCSCNYIHIHVYNIYIVTLYVVSAWIISVRCILFVLLTNFLFHCLIHTHSTASWVCKLYNKNYENNRLNLNLNIYTIYTYT